MNASYFTENLDVVNLITQANSVLSNKVFSDVKDEHGNQYVDLVMEGGGVLGIALAGYTYALEQFGIRFRSTGGTSAGAINALLIQALGAPSEARSIKLAEYVAKMPMNKFQDGGYDGKLFIKSWLSNNKFFRIATLGIVDDLIRDIGINPGDAFHKWVKQKLKENGIDTWSQLKSQMNTMPNGLTYTDQTGNTINLADEEFSPELKVVAAELSTTTKVVLPERDGKLFYTNVDDANPADFVRASMSVPFFFHPFRLRNLPHDQATVRSWLDLGYNGNIPDEAVFVDGGIISNFPISLFHTVDAKPKLPTFGVKLGIERDKAREIKGLMSLSGAMIDVMRHDSDEEFIQQNPDYKHLVKEIDTGDHHWLNFSMKDPAKLDLFVKGVRSAIDFLEGFDWKEYKGAR